MSVLSLSAELGGPTLHAAGITRPVPSPVFCGEAVVETTLVGDKLERAQQHNMSHGYGSRLVASTISTLISFHQENRNTLTKPK